MVCLRQRHAIRPLEYLCSGKDAHCHIHSALLLFNYYCTFSFFFTNFFWRCVHSCGYIYFSFYAASIYFITLSIAILFLKRILSDCCSTLHTFCAFSHTWNTVTVGNNTCCSSLFNQECERANSNVLSQNLAFPINNNNL